jgi:hypothetical protein
LIVGEGHIGIVQKPQHIVPALLEVENYAGCLAAYRRSPGRFPTVPQIKDDRATVESPASIFDRLTFGGIEFDTFQYCRFSEVR